MLRIGTLVGLMFFPFAASAQVVITEVMYDLKEGSDSGREWIEVYNAGSAPIDLAKWRLVEGGKNHMIAKVRGSFDGGTYAVIADNPTKFAADHPEYAGALFDSAFSLSNDGETLSLHASGSVVDEVRFTKDAGGSGTGDSLQRVDVEARVFAAGIPTPGAPVPEGGIVRTPPQGPASKPASQPISAAVVRGEHAQRDELHIAAAAGTGVPAPFWEMAVGMVALGGAAGIVCARRLRETEWEIIEES